jgi:hypothetical protein
VKGFIMKNLTRSFFWTAFLTGGLVMSVAAQTDPSRGLGAGSASTAQTVSTAQPGVSTAVAQDTTPALSYGVADVVNLTRAQVSESIILTYVQNSGTTYSLGPKEITYLKGQGVSDTVVAAMLSKHSSSGDTVAQTQTQPFYAPQFPVADVPPPVDYSYAAPAPVFNPNPMPAPEPVSTLYIIPYPPSQRTYSASPYIVYGGCYTYPCYSYSRCGASYRYGGYGHGYGYRHH